MDSPRSHHRSGLKTRPGLIATIALLAAVVLAACGGSSSDGSASVTSSERTWVDETRATPATATFAGAPTRTLRVRCWLPGGNDPLPLLLIAHGFGGLPEEFDAFARAVAAAGFVVAAPAFPLTSAGAPGGHQAGLPDYVNQPGDLSFVLTQLLGATDTPGDALHGRIAADAVAALGQSLGGPAVLALTRKLCCRDDRVRASIVVAAPWQLVAGYGPDPLAPEGPPTLIMHGTADMTVAFTMAEQLFDLLDPPRLLLGIQGAGHSDSLESQVEPPIAARAAAQRAVIAFLDAALRGRERELDGVLAELGDEGHIVER